MSAANNEDSAPDTDHQEEVSQLLYSWQSRNRSRRGSAAKSKDAHSDEICFQTVSGDLEDALKETKAVVATLIPEQYKPTAVEAKTHSILGRPLYIASNANADILWTGMYSLQMFY
jgi:hypothetical protein